MQKHMQGAKVISRTMKTVSCFKKIRIFKDLKLNISKSQAFIWINSIWTKEVVSTYDIIFSCLALAASIWRLRGPKIVLLEKALEEVISYQKFVF